MASHDSKVREKGQVTIPSAVRDDFGLQVGDTITFYIVDNEIRIRRPRDIARSTAGVLKQYTNGKPILTPEEIDRVASEAIAESGIHTLREIEENYDNS